MSMLTLHSIEKYYGDFHAIKGVSLKIESGEFIVMVGPSGCGKSTLLRAIAGLEDITSGQVFIGGKNVTQEEPADRNVAMVFQNYALYPHMTVRENMGFALKVVGRMKEEIQKAVESAAETLRITRHLDKKPKALSGGQKQRVAIGRAITRAPEVFLFDEPLSNLDAALRGQMRVELGRLHKKLGVTMVYVTHDQTEAMTMASRIVVLNNGEIEQIGTPLELYNRPDSQFVAGFLGSPKINFIDGKLVEKTGDTVSVKLSGTSHIISLDLDDDAPETKIESQVRLGIRPENVHLDGNIPTTVALVESLGNQTLIYLDGGEFSAIESETADGFVSAQLPSQHRCEIGDVVNIGWSPEQCYLFDASGRRLCSPHISTSL